MTLIERDAESYAKNPCGSCGHVFPKGGYFVRIGDRSLYFCDESCESDYSKQDKRNKKQ